MSNLSIETDVKSIATLPKKGKGGAESSVEKDMKNINKTKSRTKRSLEQDLDKLSTPPKKAKYGPGKVPLTPSAIDEPSTSVTLEALLADVSPIKNKHFVGELVDETTSIRLVGFDPDSQAKLEALSEQKVPIQLENCDVQYNKFTKKLEVIVKRYTKIEVSSRKFEISDVDSIGATFITLEQLTSMKEFDRVNIRVKVINVKKTQIVGNNKKKQEVVTAGATSNCVLTLWEEDIDTLELDESYYMTKVLVRVYNGDFTLSFQAMRSKVVKIEDIEDVMEETVDMMEPIIEGVTIIAVKELQKFKACMFCKGKVDETDEFGTCQKCQTVQKLNKCVYSEMAKIVVVSPSMEIVTLVAYADILKCRVDGEVISEYNLLKVKPFDVTYNMYNVITSVTK